MATLYISRGRVCAHIHVHEKEEHVRAKELAASHTKKPAEQPSCNGKNRWRHRKIYPYLGCIFSKGGEKTEKNSFLTPPQKNPWSSGSVSRKQSFLCQPENRNFPGTANFMSSKGHKFPGYDHFHANRKTKKINLTTFFFAPLGNPDRNSFPERQKIRKKFPEKLETELQLQNRFFPCGKANGTTEISHRKDIFAQEDPHFLCFLTR